MSVKVSQAVALVTLSMGIAPNAIASQSSLEDSTLPARGSIQSNAPRTAGMIRLSGGLTTLADSSGKDPWGRPAGPVSVLPFFMDQSEVTVAQWKQFLVDYQAARGAPFVSNAERAGWSYVLNPSSWQYDKVVGANWRYPEGPQGSPARDTDPVTQVAVDDAYAFATFYGKRLPTLAELQYATFGGEPRSRYPWGDSALADGNPRANLWHTRGDDGFEYRASVKSFAANERGFYGLIGNVAEMTEESDGKGGFFSMGGSWGSVDAAFSPRQWDTVRPGVPMNTDGFRCALDTPERRIRFHQDPSSPVRGDRKIVIDISDQRLYYYEGGGLFFDTPISTGIYRGEDRPGYRGTETPTGSFRIGFKDPDNISEKYGNAPMPWSLHVTGGIFIHGSAAPDADFGRALESLGDGGKVGSRGCIRMRFSDAKTLYDRVKTGDRIVIRE